jgi:ATP-dependent DNA helicase DinG
MTSTQTAPKTFAEAEVVLAQTLPGYESRPPQQRMAAFVEGVLANDEHGFAEAGCGTGKSLGAMIPAILSGKRVIVATATIALMEQYANKDVPFLEEHLGVPFTWALLKGRSNYFCRAKAVDPKNYMDANLLADLNAELDANPEHTGDREHFVTPVTKEQFSGVSMSSADCPGRRECPFGDVCFAEAAKAKAKDSQVVITNTAMLITDLKVRESTDGGGSMLGDFEAVIIDEAHELEEITTSQLEETFRPSNTLRLLKDVITWVSLHGGSVKAENDVTSATNTITAILPDPKRDRRRLAHKFFLEEHGEEFFAMIEALKALREDVLSTTVKHGDSKKETAKRQMLLTRIGNQIRRYTSLLMSDDTQVVRWVENEEVLRQGNVKTLHFAPVHVGAFLDQWLWNGYDANGDYVSRAAVLVSATMSTGGNFNFIKERLGLQDAKTMNVGTPFNYRNQAMLFVPASDLPTPKEPAWMTYANVATRELINHSGGGALLLFTSRTAMTQAVSELRGPLEASGLTVLVQGLSGSNKEIAKTFAEDTHSVLFALKSFFTGVDIQGDSLRLVIINKMPFPVPSEPVFQARGDMLKRQGKNDFNDLSIPMMTLTLQQGFGRLIRTMNDRGVVAILDSRLSGTGYGRKIVGDLPDCPVTTDLTQVKEFFAQTA